MLWENINFYRDSIKFLQWICREHAGLERVIWGVYGVMQG